MNMGSTSFPKVNPDQIGISSYCYRHNFGFNQFKPEKPMTIMDLMYTVKKLGVNRIQLCENTGYAEYSDSELFELKEMANELGLFIELGMDELSQENILRHLEIVKIFSAKFLRVVLRTDSPSPEKDKEDFYNYSIKILKEILPRFIDMDVFIGIENHYDLPSNYLVRMVEEIDDKRIGLLFDSTNCLGFIERPEEVIKAFGPHLLSIHIKDYIVHKIPGGYRIIGVPLGEGQQDIKGILISSLQYNPQLSILAEMPINSENKQNASEITEWERTAVKRCTDYLIKTIPSI